MVTVQVRLVRPAPTGTHWRKVVSGEPTGASPSQSVLPPGLLVKVAVMESPGCAVVALTVRLVPLTVSGWMAEMPPPGAGVTTEVLTKSVPVAVRVKAPPPTPTAAGLMLVSVGGGAALTGAPGTIVEAVA